MKSAADIALAALAPLAGKQDKGDTSSLRQLYSHICRFELVFLVGASSHCPRAMPGARAFVLGYLHGDLPSISAKTSESSLLLSGFSVLVIS